VISVNLLPLSPAVEGGWGIIPLQPWKSVSGRVQGEEHGGELKNSWLLTTSWQKAEVHASSGQDGEAGQEGQLQPIRQSQQSQHLTTPDSYSCT
jgi:hypothetical protein